MRVLRRDDADYESARRDAVWRKNIPDRYPAVIVRPESVDDVAAAVALAASENLAVGVCSGGHSWTSPHLRDGCLLVDLRGLTEIEIDAEARTAWVSPAVKGRALNDALAPFGLMSPVGHHDSVALGGFVLGGGFGWNFREWGNGCHNVLEIEVVTADGTLIRASDTENTEYFWAARGGGPGYFGIITGFRLRAYPRPTCLRADAYVFPAEQFEPALRWLYAAKEQVPRNCELLAVWTAHDPASGAPTLPIMSIQAFTFTDDAAEAESVAQVFDRCPVADRALQRMRSAPITYEMAADAATAAYLPGRYAMDNVYTDADVAALLPVVLPIVTSLPTARSIVYWSYTGPRPDLDGMALSAWGEAYLNINPSWTDPAQDRECETWAVASARALAPIANGTAQMNDENMAAHPQRYLSDAAAARLSVLRDTYDPAGRFLSFLGPATDDPTSTAATRWREQP